MIDRYLPRPVVLGPPPTSYDLVGWRIIHLADAQALAAADYADAARTPDADSWFHAATAVADCARYLFSDWWDGSIPQAWRPTPRFAFPPPPLR